MINFKPGLSILFLALCLSVGFMFSTSQTEAASMKADINTASMEQLMAVQGVGHDTAQNILDYKKNHGVFTTMDELENVNGVGAVRLEALREAFSVNSKKLDAKASTKK